MATSSETIQTISIVSLLGLLMFSVVWMFVSGAAVSIPPHSLRSDVLEMGRPIQAVAIDIDKDIRNPSHAVSESQVRPNVPRALVAFARPVAAVVQQLTQPVPAVQPSLDRRAPDAGPAKAKKGPRSDDGPKGKGAQVRSGKAKDDRTSPGQAKVKQHKEKRKGRGGSSA